MSRRGTHTTMIPIRLIDDPKVTARFQIQERVDHDEWITLRMFSNEHEARTMFEHIKTHGLGVRVMETAKAPVS